MCFPVYHPRGYIGPGYQGTLGYGFATALGAKAADPSRAVISVTGDGGFSWTMQELSTLRRYGLGMVTIVFNDGYFGNVRRIQKNRYGGRYFASDLTNPDYQQLAGAFGIGFACARDPGSLAGVLRDAVAASEPVLVEVPVGEFPSPWHLIHEGIPRPAPIAPGAHLPDRAEARVTDDHMGEATTEPCVTTRHAIDLPGGRLESGPRPAPCGLAGSTAARWRTCSISSTGRSPARRGRSRSPSTAGPARRACG